jgi:predicted PurR-regulated permease PerM
MKTREIKDDWLAYQNARKMLVVALTAIGLYLCYRLALPFLPALALALGLANIALPVHGWIKKRVKNASFAAGLSVTFIAATILTVVFFLGRQVFREIERSAAGFRQVIESHAWRASLEQNSRLAAAFAWLEAEINLQDAALRLAEQIPAFISGFLVGSWQAIVQLGAAFFILFFFFRDREELLHGLRRLMPLSDAETDRLFASVNDTLHASVNSLVVVAAAQGALGGLMFWILGLPAPLMWGFVMAILAMLPFFGTFMIWIPAAIILAINGNYIKAMILIGWGVTAVSMIDNLLYPKLVGDRLRFHTLLIFIAFLGGISLFGAAGIILGPVTLAVTAALLDIWRERTADETRRLTSS